LNTDVALATESKHEPDSTDQQYSASALILSEGAMDRLYRFAETMAAGVATMPKHLQGNVADCFAVCTQAHLWRMNPYAVAQKSHISQSGQLGYDGQLVNAVITTLAPIKHRPEYEYLGDWSKILGQVEERKSDKGGKFYVATWKPADEAGLGIIVRCTLKGEDKPREITVMMSQAWPRFSTQWATDPQQQIGYLAVRKWARRYTPDVLLGVYVPEELDQVDPPRNMGAAEIVGEHDRKPTGLSAAQLAAWRAAAEKGMVAAREFWAKSFTAAERNLATEAQKVAMRDLAVKADQKRTVDDDDKQADPKKEAADKPAPKPAADAAPPAATGAPSGVDQDFIDAMDRVDNGK